MDVFEAIKIRKSIRRFSERAIEKEKLKQILEAARLAPSWKNWQCWSYIVIDDTQLIRELAATGGFGSNTWLRDAPCVIVACGDPKGSGDRNDIRYYAVDVAISMEQLVLAATDLGLGTCWIGIFEESVLKSSLNIPDDLKIVALTPVGYPADKGFFYYKLRSKATNTKRRRSMTDIVHYNRW